MYRYSRAAIVARMSGSRGASSIYLGDAVSHGSDRALFAHLVELLERTGDPYVILANCQLGQRQIDCILATAQRVVVFEAKATRWSIKGGVNGNWARRQPDGSFALYTNAYLQALHAKNALRDAMAAGGQLGSWYPDARVVFTTGLPIGSNVTTGDHKVRVIGIDTLDIATLSTGSPWPLERWHAFARHHQLEPASLEQATATSALQQAHVHLSFFRNAVAREYSRDGNRWLAETEAVGTALLSALLDGPGTFVSGPSGCGKTLLARRAAAELAARGATVLHLSARLYDGSWQTLIRREIALLSDAAPSVLYRAARDTGAPVAIILDGLNELPDAEDALRGLRALTSRLDARLIVTAQGGMPAQLSGLERIGIERPSLRLKQRIAADAGALGDAAPEALKAVGSGFEASVIGAIAGKIERDQSRQGLLDLFVRERLGQHARLGVLGLRRLAASLHAALAFSVGETAFDEQMLALGVSDGACNMMFSSGLLVRRGGRVSFAHEMLRHACAAHGLGIAVARDTATWANLLDTLPFEDIAGDVLSVVESRDAVRAILAGSSRPALLRASALGRHGAIAHAVAEALLDQAYQDCIAEIAGLTLLVVPGARATVNWDPDALRSWTPQEAARLAALGADLHSQSGVTRHMALCLAMDVRLYNERRRVFEEAKAAGCVALRTHAFWLAYYGFGRQTGFLHVCRSVQRSHEEPPAQLPERAFDITAMTSGQLHFYLENRYSLVPEAGHQAFAEQLTWCLETRFTVEPYHVKLAILNAAGFARTGSEDGTNRLIAAVQALEVEPGNLGVHSAVTDALKFLGAIEDPNDEYRQLVRAELADATSDEITEQRCELALTLAGAQFDHPYDEIYYGEVEKLPEERRRNLYRRALAADTRHSSNLAWLVRQVAGWGDIADVPRMQVLALLPDREDSIPQEVWGAFVDATCFLGRHGIPLENGVGEGDAGRCLILVRSLVHAAAAREARGPEALGAWTALTNMPVGDAIGALGEVQRALQEAHWSERVQPFEHLDLAAAYPRQCLALARAFLDANAEAAYFHHGAFREDGPNFVFHAIGSRGDRSDLERLRAHSLGPHARSALGALKKLDLVVGG